jgi:dCTP diphosphatase
MTDSDTTVATLRDRAVVFRDERDWMQFHLPKDLALAVTVEAGELGELFLWKLPDEVTNGLASPEFRTRLADEMADVLIFLLYLAEATGVDLSEAVDAKIRKNGAKYPVERSRGSAAKYTELG